MTLHKCNLSVSLEDIREIYLRHFPDVTASLDGTLLSGLTSPEVSFEQGVVVLSAKKRVPLLGEVTVAVKARPNFAADGHTLRMAIERITAGPLETATFTKLIISKIGAKIKTFPGCRIDGNDLLVDIAELAAAKDVRLGGRIIAVEMLADSIAILVA